MEDEGTGGCGGDLVTDDALVGILLRVPPSSRRRLRLVGRHWRDLVDARAAVNQRSQAKTLVVTAETVYVLDDLSMGLRRKLWTSTAGRLYEGMSVVGTCNGLICLCDDRIKPAGAIILANPVTGETLALPLLPYGGGKQVSWYRPYSFTYNPARGQYKVVHVSYDHDRISVFTLGEASWRHVPGPDNETIAAGTIIVNGTMYWTVRCNETKVMSLDLHSECISPVESLPSVLSRSIPSIWRRLMEVHGRLCIAISHVSQAMNKEEMWVMEGHQGRWSRWYSVHKHTPPPWYQRQWQWDGDQRLTWPHFAHGSEHVLTQSHAKGNYVLYGHRPSDSTRKTKGGVVEISGRSQGTVVARINTNGNTFRTFTYIETTEPLSVYMCW